jgi:hypothetical protein
MTVMAETSFEVKYEGEALRDGRMPVRDLAPALLALGQLFTEASQLLYPENEPVSLEIEATKEGSFEVGLVLHAAGMAWDQISTNPLGSAGALLIFKEAIIGGNKDISLFGLVKWLHGKLVKAEEPGSEPGEVILVLEDGSKITVPLEVAALNRDPQIRKKLRQVVEPLRREGVDSLEIRTDDKPTVELNEEDVPAFEVPELEPAEVISQQEVDVFLDVLSPDLEKGGNRKWRFGGLGGNFMADIEDAGFMEKVAQREATFGVGDQIHAKVQIVQKRDPGTNKIRDERRVLEVLEVINAPEQLSLKDRIDQAQESLGSESDAQTD